MIAEAEIRRMAARLAMDPMIVDLDYVLGCFLAALYRRPESAVLRFKGGTCLRKCYFADYRFSEDLDFTLLESMRRQAIEELFGEVAAAAADQWQVDFTARPLRMEVVDDEYGKESYQVRLYYRGPLRRTGDPRAIRLDVTVNEVMALPASERPIIHPYSDRDLLSHVTVPCYHLLEMAAEKVRALAGQRRYAISRDLYDLAQLQARAPLDVETLAPTLPRKWTVKGLVPGPVDLERLAGRRDEFRRDWQQNLMRLLPSDTEADFDVAWDAVMGLLADVNHRWPQAS